MENILQVAQILLLFSLSALAIYFIIVLSKLKSSIIKFANDFNILTEKLIPILQSTDEQLKILKSALESFKSMTENIVALEKKIQSQIESPILEVIGIFTSLIKKIRNF